MAIQEVNIGLVVNDGGGDPLRTAFEKINSNVTDNANMASKLAQTSPTDATAGRGLLTDALGDNGGPIFTEANLNPNVFGGVGANDRLMSDRAAVSTSVIDFYIPSSYKSTPTLDTVTSTFSLIDKGGSVVASGISAANISVNSLSSNKCLIIRVSTAGLTIGNDYVLVSETASSKITVNG